MLANNSSNPLKEIKCGVLCRLLRKPRLAGWESRVTIKRIMSFLLLLSQIVPMLFFGSKGVRNAMNIEIEWRKSFGNVRLRPQTYRHIAMSILVVLELLGNICFL